MSQIIPTIPALCPFTTWINTWNPFTSVLPDRNTPLDLRPAGIDWYVFQDSLIGCWECPECMERGTIKPGINDGIPVADTIDLPGRFWSVINGAEDSGDIMTAMIVALHAAWWSDDQGQTTAAREFRNRALNSARSWHQSGKQFCTPAGLDEVMIADLLRRSCNFDQVPDIAMAGMKKSPDSLIQKALQFQLHRAETWDTLCYSFAFEPIDMNFKNHPTIESTLQE